MTRRAIVVGGSISGLFAACLLRQKDWQVDVYERSDVELKGRGAGIVSHQELLDILTQSGAGIADLGIHVDDRVLFDSLGDIVGRHRFPQIVTSWDRLQNLARGVQPEGTYHLNCNFIGFDQTANGVTVHFDGGRSVTGDILDEADLDPETHEDVFEKFAFFLAPGHEVVGYPIAGTNNDLRPGKRRYNFVWYRTISVPRLDDMLTDASGHTHAISIPPPLVREEIVHEMREMAETFMCKPLLKVLRAIKSAFFTPIYDLASPSMTFGRVVLIGDAAFVARPHVGMGVTKGAADARALADALSGDDIEDGLRSFNAKRKPIGDRVFARGRELGAFLNDDFEGALDEKHRNDLLRNTAADHFLHQQSEERRP